MKQWLKIAANAIHEDKMRWDMAFWAFSITSSFYLVSGEEYKHTSTFFITVCVVIFAIQLFASIYSDKIKGE